MAVFDDMEVKFVRGNIEFTINGEVAVLDDKDMTRFIKFIDEVAVLVDEYETIERLRKIDILKEEIKEREAKIKELQEEE